MKTLIVYYSYEENTHMVAKRLAEKLNADLLRLEPVKEMKSKGFSKYIWGGRQAVMKTTPSLKPYTFKSDDYDLIIFGTPVWAFTLSPPLRSFFAENNMNDVNTAYFYCHEGGPGKTDIHFQESLTGNKIISKTDFIKPKAAVEQKVDQKIDAFIKVINNGMQNV